MSDNREKEGPVVGILGHTGNENLGDESITVAVIKNLSRRLPGARIRLFSINPEDSRQRHGLPAFRLRPPEDATVSSLLYRNWQSVGNDAAEAEKGLPPLHETSRFPSTKVLWPPGIKQRIRTLLKVLLYLPSTLINEMRFNRQSKKALEDMSLLIVCGSNQFLDNFGGPWAFPFTLLRWSWLASRGRVRLAFVSVGAGPVYSRLSLRMFNKALSYASYVSVRDAASAQIIRKGGYSGPLEIAPDLAFSLPDAQPEEVRTDRGNGRVIGINPMPVYAKDYWYVDNAKLYSAYVSALAELAIALARKGHRVFFFATQKRDERVISDVRTTMEASATPEDHADIGFEPCATVVGLQSVIRSADFVVATRFHGTVLGLKANKLVLGTCYYRKAADLLDEFGLGEFAFPLEELDVGEILSRIDAMLRRETELLTGVASQNKKFQAQAAEQYDRLCALVGAA